ncbi:MAG: cache domain-containing protein, partial [Bilophila sp.]
MKLSIVSKLAGLVLVMVIVACLSTLFATVTFLDKPFNQEIREFVSSMQQVVDVSYKTTGQTYLNEARLVAGSEGFAEAVATKDSQKLLELAKPLMQGTHADFMTITDEKGVVLARGHSSKLGDSVNNQKTVTNALKGQSTVGVVSGTVEPYTMRAGSPVIWEGKVVGTVGIGLSLARESYVDNIKALSN